MIGSRNGTVKPCGKRSHRVTRLFSNLNGAGGPLSRRQLLKIIGGVVVTIPPALEIYSRLGSTDSDFSDDILPQPSDGSWDDVEEATLVFHGAAGQDKFTDALMENLKRNSSRSKYSSMIEWSQFSSNILQASFNGQRLGRNVASDILKRAPNLKSLHIIGISVGAFAADSVCSQSKASKQSVYYVQLTLLDPFTQRGIFDTGYGARNYGKDADYFQQYLNTDDPVPSTNAPLQQSVCYDITAIRPQEISFGHDWPVAYYSQQHDIGIVPPAQRLKPGTIIRPE